MCCAQKLRFKSTSACKPEPFSNHSVPQYPIPVILPKTHSRPYHDGSRRYLQELCFGLHPTFISHTILPYFIFARRLLLPSDRDNAYDDMLYLISDKNNYQSVRCCKIFPHHKFRHVCPLHDVGKC